MAADRRYVWDGSAPTAASVRWFTGLFFIAMGAAFAWGAIARTDQGIGTRVFLAVASLGVLALGVWMLRPDRARLPLPQIFESWQGWTRHRGLEPLESPGSLVLPTAAGVDASVTLPITHAAQGTVGDATFTAMILRLHSLEEPPTRGFVASAFSTERPHAPTPHTVLAVHTKTKYPPITVVPQRGVHDVAAAAGRDVDTESAAFNAKYRVIAKDKETAHAVLQPKVIDLLLGFDLDAPVTWDGNSIVVEWFRLVGDPAELDRYTEFLLALRGAALGFHQVEPEGAPQLREPVRVRVKTAWWQAPNAIIAAILILTAIFAQPFAPGLRWGLFGVGAVMVWIGSAALTRRANDARREALRQYYEAD